MKLRYAILLILTFLMTSSYFIPMKSLSSLLQLKYEDIHIENENGKWWSGSLQGVQYLDTDLGNIMLIYDPKLLFEGKLGFSVIAKNKNYDFKGIFAYNHSQNYLLEKAFLRIKINKAFINNTKYPLTLSNISIDLPILNFNKLGCNHANGKMTGNLLDVYGFFNQEIGLKASIECKNKELTSTFRSTPKENLLFGKFTLNTHLDYYVEVSSGKVVSKLQRFAKFNFSSEPSIKFSGSLKDLLN
jgi:hypothetical protein